MNLTIIIPAYNAESFIENTIEQLLNNFNGSEIIIINDGSKDKTLEKIQKYESKIKIINHTNNLGKGMAIRNGFDIATNDNIIFTDADLPYGIENMQKMYGILENNDNSMVIGYRKYFKENLWRHMTHIGMNIAIQFLFWFNIYDTQCGLKGFKRNFIKSILSKLISNNFTIDVELMYLAKINKQKIIKVLVDPKMSKDTSTIKIKDIIIMIIEILKIRFNKNYFKK